MTPRPELPSTAVSQPDQTFYAVAAQVLPVLFLVAAIEQRVGSNSFPKTFRAYVWELATIPLLIVSLVVGEVAALQALATDHSNHLIHLLTVLSLVLAGFSVIAEAMNLSFQRAEERTEAEKPEWLPVAVKARWWTMNGLGIAVLLVYVAYVFTS